jgi:hypothetical protein
LRRPHGKHEQRAGAGRRVSTELLWVLSTVVGTVFTYLTALVPCGLPAVPAAASTIAAGLAITAAIACKK